MELLARTLITELDWSFKGNIPRSMYNNDTYLDAYKMLYGVQLAAGAYCNGSTQIDGRLESQITEELLSVPADKRLPDVIEMLYNEI